MKNHNGIPMLPPVFDPMRTLRLAGMLSPVAIVALFLLVGGPSGCRRPRQAAVFKAETALAEQLRSSSDEMIRMRESSRPIEDVKGALAATKAFEAPPVVAAEPTPQPPAPPPPPSNLVAEVATRPAEISSETAPSPLARFVLQGIVWSETVPLALIDGQTLGVGESIGGRKLVRIERERVILSGQDGETKELRLDEEGSPRPEAAPAGKP